MDLGGMLMIIIIEYSFLPEGIYGNTGMLNSRTIHVHLFLT